MGSGWLQLIGPGGLLVIFGMVGGAVRWLTIRRDAQTAKVEARANALDAQAQLELTEARAALRVAQAEKDRALAEERASRQILEAENRRLTIICYGYIRQMLTHRPPLHPEPPDPHTGGATRDGRRQDDHRSLEG